jgi:hypothetical protein
LRRSFQKQKSGIAGLLFGPETSTDSGLKMRRELTSIHNWTRQFASMSSMSSIPTPNWYESMHEFGFKPSFCLLFLHGMSVAHSFLEQEA